MLDQILFQNLDPLFMSKPGTAYKCSSCTHIYLTQHAFGTDMPSSAMPKEPGWYNVCGK